MDLSELHYFPVAWPFLLLLIGLLGLVAAVVAVRIVTYASSQMGIGPRTMLGLLLLSLLGSYVNIPVAHEPAHTVAMSATVSFFGIRYLVPVLHRFPATVLAVNVGGALVPVLVSFYLLMKTRQFGLSLVGTGIVAIVCYYLSWPVPGIGIAIPIVVPALVTALVALSLSRRYAGPLAYICGSLGTLIGADLMNLAKVPEFGAPVASIGGAGTFDGIFLTGLTAVVCASLVSHRSGP